MQIVQTRHSINILKQAYIISYETWLIICCCHLCTFPTQVDRAVNFGNTVFRETRAVYPDQTEKRNSMRFKSLILATTLILATSYICMGNPANALLNRSKDLTPTSPDTHHKIKYPFEFSREGLPQNPERIIYVPDDHYDIQDAIDAADDGDLILVSPGEYRGGVRFYGKDIILAGRFVINQDPCEIEQTIITGSKCGSAVTFAGGETENALIAGFTITGGSASSGFNNFGGGIDCSNNSNPTIRDCIITDNTAVPEEDDNPGMHDLRSWNGGGISCRNSSPTIEHCLISDNTAFTSGGGIFCDALSSPTVYDCNISGNNAARGGGVAVLGNGYIDMQRCIISYNTVESCVFGQGGGLMIGDAFIRDCEIFENTAEHGGGVYCGPDYDPQIVSTIVHDNCAGYGGGFFFHSSRAEIINCTIAGNHGDKIGGSMLVWGDGNDIELPSITNTIIWDNQPSEIFIQSAQQPDYFPIRFSTLEGGEAGIRWSNGDYIRWGENNLSSDPVFTDADRGEFTLAAGSPCIDSGIDCGFEYNGAAPDMGACESAEPNDLAEQGSCEIPQFAFLRAYPNPFNCRTTIGIDLPRRTKVSLSIFNLNGKKIATITEGDHSAGHHEYAWSAENLPGGVYFAHLQAGEHELNAKLTVIK